MTIRQIARAKINLCLHVTGQRADGYHLLDSVVVFADVGDVLTFEPASSVSLSIDGPFGDGLAGQDDNLILKAARAFGGGGRGARIHLTKNLPVASGIGGGSADAAAALRGLAELWSCDLPGPEAQLALGADVPVCVAGGAVRMEGIGESITPLPAWPELDAVLVNPGVGVATPAVFGALDSRENPPISAVLNGDVVSWLRRQRNDLEAPARALEPVIGDVLFALENRGAQLARMSGSGATCFGLFGSAQEAAEAGAALAADHPAWWVQTTRLTT